MQRPWAGPTLVGMARRRPRRSRPRRRRGAAVGAAGLLIVALLPGVASGHAAGPPPHATLDADGDIVTIDWVAVDDDAAAVGVAVGLLPAETVDAYFGRGPWEDVPSEQEIRAFSQAPELRAYLASNIAVLQDGEPCRGVVDPAEDFVRDGARLTFTCPREVDEVDVRITMLHDADPRYRTFSVDGTYQTSVHTVERPTHTWDFTGASALPPGLAGGPPHASGLAAGGLAALLAGAGGLLVLRRRGALPPALARLGRAVRRKAARR